MKLFFKRLSKKFNLALLSILLISAFLRFYLLGIIPSGFHADEAAYGYNAYSILQTARDEYGKFLPVVLKSFGEYKPALYSYFDIPFIAIFGLTPFSVRIVSALFGTLSILMLFLITRKIFNDEKISLISSFLLAISPWHINLSRTTSEVVVAVFFSLLSIFLFLLSKEKKKKIFFFAAIVSALIAIGTYTAIRMFLIIGIIVYYLFVYVRTKSLKTERNLFVYFVLIFSACIFFNLFDSANRFSQISIFGSPSTQLVLDEQIREDFGGTFFSRAMHNKAINYARTFLQNYGKYFTLDFLVLEGGNPKRMQIPGSGLFYLWEIPFMFIGIFYVLKKKDIKLIFIILLWLFLLIPASVTFDEIPNVYRSLIILPLIIVIMSFGVKEFISKNNFSKILLILLLAFGVWEFVYYLHQYYVHQEVHQAWNRGYAYKPLFERLKEYSSYKKIVITKGESSPYIYLLFYNKYDPKKYQNLGSPRDNDYTGFDNYFFEPFDCPLSAGKLGTDEVNGKPGVIYVNKASCVTPLHDTKILSTINWKDGTPAFKILEYIPKK